MHVDWYICWKVLRKNVCRGCQVPLLRCYCSGNNAASLFSHRLGAAVGRFYKPSSKSPNRKWMTDQQAHAYCRRRGLPPGPSMQKDKNLRCRRKGEKTNSKINNKERAPFDACDAPEISQRL